MPNLLRLKNVEESWNLVMH